MHRLKMAATLGAALFSAASALPAAAQESRFSLEEMELLGLFGNQAAIALDLLQKSRRAKAVLENGDSDSALLARVAENLERLEGQRRAAGVELLRSLEALFKH